MNETEPRARSYRARATSMTIVRRARAVIDQDGRRAEAMSKRGVTPDIGRVAVAPLIEWSADGIR